MFSILTTTVEWVGGREEMLVIGPVGAMSTKRIVTSSSREGKRQFNQEGHEAAPSNIDGDGDNLVLK